MGRKQKREHLLNQYMSIISRLKLAGENGDSVPLTDCYICPLCLKSFNLKQCDNKSGDILTLEDVPPKSLGGTPCLLTCRSCNSRCGHEVDVFLYNEIRSIDEKIDFSKPKRGILSKNDIKLNATVELGDSGYDINISHHNNNPSNIDAFKRSFCGENGNSKLNLKVKKYDYKLNTERAKIAALKSAYLIAFKKLGYQYILNNNLNKVRQQILCPDKNILNDAYMIGENNYLPKNFPDGVYLAEIETIKCISVIFSLKLKNSNNKHQIIVILPCPDDSECEVYSKLLSCNNTQLSILGIAKVIPKKKE